MFNRRAFLVEAVMAEETEVEEEGQMISGKGETIDYDFPFTLMMILKSLINSYRQVS